MVGCLRNHDGGIRGLAQLVDEHGEAIRYELLRVGLRLEDLGTRRLTWLDLAAVIQHAPPGNALEREIAPVESGWTITDHLLAAVVNLLAVGNWQRSGDPTAPRPKPLLPPGTPDPDAESYGSGAIPLHEFDAWWDS